MTGPWLDLASEAADTGLVIERLRAWAMDADAPQPIIAAFGAAMRAHAGSREDAPDLLSIACSMLWRERACVGLHRADMPWSYRSCIRQWAGKDAWESLVEDIADLVGSPDSRILSAITLLQDRQASPGGVARLWIADRALLSMERAFDLDLNGRGPGFRLDADAAWTTTDPQGIGGFFARWTEWASGAPDAVARGWLRSDRWLMSLPARGIPIGPGCRVAPIIDALRRAPADGILRIAHAEPWDPRIDWGTTPRRPLTAPPAGRGGAAFRAAAWAPEGTPAAALRRHLVSSVATRMLDAGAPEGALFGAPPVAAGHPPLLAIRTPQGPAIHGSALPSLLGAAGCLPDVWKRNPEDPSIWPWDAFCASGMAGLIAEAFPVRMRMTTDDGGIPDAPWLVVPEFRLPKTEHDDVLAAWEPDGQLPTVVETHPGSFEAHMTVDDQPADG